MLAVSASLTPYLQTFKLAKSLGFGDEDTAAVYKALQGDKRS